MLPIVRAARTAVIAGLFLAEFLTAGECPALSRVTSAPARAPLPVNGDARVDAYGLPAPVLRTPLVLVHGLTADGKDDPRLVEAAGLLARAGFAVAAPTIPGLTRLRLRPEDRQPVVAALAARREPAVLVGVSVGAGVAILAAAEPTARERVALVLSLGGYASAAELVRYYLTGEFGHGTVRGRVSHAPELIERFVEANADLLDPSARRVLTAATPGDVDRALDTLSPALHRLLDELSPERVVARLPGPLVLVHGRGDVAVPYTESLRLAAARPRATRVVLVGILSHVEGAGAEARRGALWDLLALWGATYRLVTPA